MPEARTGAEAAIGNSTSPCNGWRHCVEFPDVHPLVRKTVHCQHVGLDCGTLQERCSPPDRTALPRCADKGISGNGLSRP